MVALSRRRFLGAAGALAGALLAGCGRDEAARSPEPDSGVLAGLLAREQTTIAAARRARRRRCVALRAQDARHAARLQRELSALGRQRRSCGRQRCGRRGGAHAGGRVRVHRSAAAPGGPGPARAVMQLAASEAEHLAALRMASGEVPVPAAFAGYTEPGAPEPCAALAHPRGGAVSAARQRRADFESARTDAGLLEAALRVEQIAALAYTAAADGPLDGARARAGAAVRSPRARARGRVRDDAVRSHRARPRARGPKDLEALAPGLRRAGRQQALRALAELEGAAIAGHQLMGRRISALDALRTVAAVMAGGAQHLVVLRDALGQEPLTTSFESGA